MKTWVMKSMVNHGSWIDMKVNSMTMCNVLVEILKVVYFTLMMCLKFVRVEIN